MCSNNAQFYTLRQTYDDEFRVECLSAGQIKLVSANGSAAGRTAPKIDAHSFLHGYAGSPADLLSEGLNPAELVDRLGHELSWLFDDKDEAQTLGLSLFILGTYCHRLFPAYPHLWLSVPPADSRPQVEGILRDLCYNGILVGSDWPRTLLLELISEATPTLLFERLPLRSNHQWQTLIQHANVAGRFYAKEISESSPMFCPKILIASGHVDRLLGEHSILMQLKPFNPPPVAMHQHEGLSLDLVRLAIHLGPVIARAIEEQSRLMHPSAPTFIFHVLGNALHRLGAINDSMLETLRSCCDGLRRHRHSQLRTDQDMLNAIRDYLRDKSVPGPQMPHPLEDIATYLNEVDLVRHITAKGLSQFLRKRSLVVKASRVRVQDGHVDGNINEAKYKQVTSVVLDERRLRQLTHTRISHT